MFARQWLRDRRGDSCVFACDVLQPQADCQCDGGGLACLVEATCALEGRSYADSSL